jgi:hypothetical protein
MVIWLNRRFFTGFFKPSCACELELFDFHLFRFSLGETTEEAIRNRKSKSYRPIFISNA